MISYLIIFIDYYVRLMIYFLINKHNQLILVSIDLLNVLSQDLQFFLCYIVYLN